MRVSEILSFAPGISFGQLDLGGEHLPEQFAARMRGYYLAPAHRAAAAGDGFAAGVLAVVALDALSRLHFGPNRLSRNVGQDFRVFARLMLPSFTRKEDVDILYSSFRNGLVHEARLKDGAQFELGSGVTLAYISALPVVDPAQLLREIDAALEAMVADLRTSAPFRRELATLLRNEFAFELQDAA